MQARSLHGFLNPLEKRTNSLWLLFPFIGSLIFIVLYVIAALLYPGGSHADVYSKGFSLLHNYWCNLLNEKGLNGELNGGRIVAIAGMIVLAITLLCFWIIYPVQMRFKKGLRSLIQLTGSCSIAALSFLSSSLHDTSINISGFFGLIAMAGAYAGIYKKRWYALFVFGMVNLLLIAANNYIYYSENGFYYLPVIQKITFVSCLLWICLVNIRLYKMPAV